MASGGSSKIHLLYSGQKAKLCPIESIDLETAQENDTLNIVDLIAGEMVDEANMDQEDKNIKSLARTLIEEWQANGPDHREANYPGDLNDAPI